MGEIDQLNDPVNHGVSQRNDGIHTAQGQAVDELLKEDVQGRSGYMVSQAVVRQPVFNQLSASFAWTAQRTACCRRPTKENSTRRCRFHVGASAPPTSRLRLLRNPRTSPTCHP